MKVTLEKGNLVISLPLDEKGIVSKSGKTLVHASTRGNQKTGVLVGGKELTIGLNAYTYKGE